MLGLAARQKLIMKPNSCKKLWIVVEVESGIAVDAKAYRTETSARRRFSGRRRSLNLEEDDIQVFQIEIPNS
jgi:hypothetical protein